jgi:hypothetical protein
MEATIAGDFGEHKVEKFAVEGLDAAEGDVTLRFHITASSFAKKAGPLLLVRPRVIGRVVESLLDLKDRIYGYDTGGPSVDLSEIDVTLPPGYTIDELPPAIRFADAGLSYNSASMLDGDTLRYRREYRVERFTIPVEELPKVNAAFAKILADERASAVLKPR